MPGPVFQNISPSPSYSILPNTLLSFQVVDTGSPIVLVVPIITLDPTVAGELVYDWTLGAFTPAYIEESEILTIANGYQFNMLRFNGWPTPPTLRCWAVDAAGNVTAL
jgi:hypothetical protein